MSKISKKATPAQVEAFKERFLNLFSGKLTNEEFVEGIATTVRAIVNTTNNHISDIEIQKELHQKGENIINGLKGFAAFFPTPTDKEQ